MKNEFVKLKEARKQLKEFSFIPESSILKALNAGLIPHMKSGQGKRACNYLKVEDLRSYLEGLKR